MFLHAIGDIHGNVHALRALVQAVHIKEEDIDHLYWLTLSTAAQHISGKTVVCGHSAQASGKIADLGHTICIDNGITKGKFITCLTLDDFSFHQADPDGKVTRGVLTQRR